MHFLSFFLSFYRKYKKKELIPSRPSPSVAGGRGFWRMGGSNISGGQVNWGLGEFVYGRQYAVSAVISQSKNQSAMNLQETQMCILSISIQYSELKYLDKQI